MTDIEQKVRQFIEDNFLFREDRAALSASESLLEAGLIDSTGILELVCHLEEKYAVDVTDDELVPENLDSLSKIARYIHRKRHDQVSAHAR